MVIILPEGRMKRENGLDLHGNPMNVRGGIADILLAMKQGRMLIAYSGGLHHVQFPGGVPRIFKTVAAAGSVPSAIWLSGSPPAWPRSVCRSSWRTSARS